MLVLPALETPFRKISADMLADGYSFLKDGNRIEVSSYAT